jgi:hypothetical protein
MCRTKQQLIALANDKAATNRRVVEIKKESNQRWSDGRVGITADGYIFYYDLHESHGTDNIRDIHLLYLPDEERFLVTHDHFCCDLSKNEQAKNKAELVKYFTGFHGLPYF